ncbi:hypothetical protein C2E31_25765 [Rhodopirellula baltica]|nr:hypothetical protein C2E31_25765 [Rhodopirellula baltica]
MFHVRSSVLGFAAALAACCAGQATSADETPSTLPEPEFRLLAIAEALASDEVLPVQFEQLNPFTGPRADTVSDQAIQPIDVGGDANFASFSLPENLAFKDWDQISAASFESNATDLPSDPNYLEQYEESQGISEIGLSESPAVEIVPGSTFNLTQSADIGETLVESSTTQTIKARDEVLSALTPKFAASTTAKSTPRRTGAICSRRVAIWTACSRRLIRS